MNPVDHPHGGGEGKTSGGRPSVTPQGKITKGQPTRKKKQKEINYSITNMSRSKYKGPFFRVNLLKKKTMDQNL